jgi:exopolysaccharide biosynthesis protein
LIKNNLIRISDNEELIAVDNTSSRARSAIGYTSSNKIVILAVEGNNSNGGAGLTLAELAQMMKEIGCIEALNLDGGGSTTLTVNGKQTVKPSDGTERGVMTALIIKAL